MKRDARPGRSSVCFSAAPARGFARVLLFAMLLAPVLPAAARALDDPARRVRTTTLENGLTVLTLEDHLTPVVSFQMWVKAGSRDESRYTGIAHLFEHMMFRGSERIGPEEHARLVNARGGRLNAYTTRDNTVYFEDVTSESLPLVIDLEAERVAHLKINAEILDKEREVVLEERRMRTEDSPSGRAFEALFSLVWTAHPYRWPVIGWRSDVERVDVKSCRRFFSNYYAPNNLVLVVVGDFEGEETLARIRRRFGAMSPVAEIPRNPTLEPEQRGPRRQTVHFDVRSPLLVIGWHAPAAGHADSTALDVLSQILSGGRSSRLYRSLVYDAQLALSAQGGYWELRDAGIFYLFASVRPGASIAATESLALQEIERVREAGVSRAEVEKARRQLEVSLVNGLTTNHAVGARIGGDFVTLGRIRPLDDRLAEIRAVSAADVQRVARLYLKEAHQNTVRVVVPPEPAGSDGDAGESAGSSGEAAR